MVNGRRTRTQSINCKKFGFENLDILFLHLGGSIPTKLLFYTTINISRILSWVQSQTIYSILLIRKLILRLASLHSDRVLCPSKKKLI